MNLQLLNFYFEKSGYSKIANKLYYNFKKGKYEIKILSNENKIYILHEKNFIFATGCPVMEASIVKWCNILIAKHETQSNSIDSKD